MGIHPARAQPALCKRSRHLYEHSPYRPDRVRPRIFRADRRRERGLFYVAEPELFAPGGAGARDGELPPILSRGEHPVRANGDGQLRARNDGARRLRRGRGARVSSCPAAELRRTCYERSFRHAHHRPRGLHGVSTASTRSRGASVLRTRAGAGRWGAWART